MPDKDYSHRDVTDKLGIKPEMAVRVVGVKTSTPGAKELLAKIEAKTGRKFVTAKTAADVILYWPKTAEEIVPTLAGIHRMPLKAQIVPNGGIWVITAKKNCTSASGMAYYNQDALIPMGKAAGLVDNKICSLNDCESAMRFVIRKTERSKQSAVNGEQ
jgi:hypothetical protein